MNTKKLSGRPILVTGGTGFVGSHLVERLLGSGAIVVVPYRSTDPRSYFFSQGLDKRVVLAQADVTDRRRMTDIVSKYEIRTIFHLAAQPIVDTAYNNPVETITTNVLGTTHVLDAAYTSGTVEEIIITSTDKAYGKSSEEYTETHPLEGDHPYDASKSAADLVARAYIRTYKAPVSIVRFGNIYGPGDMNYSRIIPGIIKSALTMEPLMLRSDGTFVRDYVYVKDVVDAYLFLLSHFDTMVGQEFNIASDVSLSVLKLVENAQKILNTNIRYTVLNNQKNEIPYQHLNWSKIRNAGWMPQYSLEMGLLETFGWYKKCMVHSS